MVSALFVVVGLADDALGDIGGEHILQSHLHLDSFLPEGVEAAGYSSRVLGQSVAVEADEGVAVSLNVGWGKLLTLVEVEHQRVVDLFFIIALNCAVGRGCVGVKIDPAGYVPSQLVALQKAQRFISIHLVDFCMFVSGCRCDFSGFDPNKTNSVPFLPAITKVHDDIWDLREVLRELHLLILHNFHEFAQSIDDLVRLGLDEILPDGNLDHCLFPHWQLEAFDHLHAERVGLQGNYWGRLEGEFELDVVLSK